MVSACPCFLLCPSHPRAQGKTQQNRKLTDFYPVRRSSRKSKAELQVACSDCPLACGRAGGGGWGGGPRRSRRDQSRTGSGLERSPGPPPRGGHPPGGWGPREARARPFCGGTPSTVACAGDPALQGQCPSQDVVAGQSECGTLGEAARSSPGLPACLPHGPVLHLWGAERVSEAVYRF